MHYTLETLLEELTTHDYYVMGQNILNALLSVETNRKDNKYLNFSDKCILTNSSYNKQFIQSFKDVLDICPTELCGSEYEFLKEIQLSNLYMERKGDISLVDNRLKNTWDGFQKALAWKLYWNISNAMDGYFDFRSWFKQYMDNFVYLVTVDYYCQTFYIRIYLKDSTVEYNILNDLKYENNISIQDFVKTYISRRFNRVKEHIDKDGYIKVISYYDNRNRKIYNLLNNVDLSYLDIKFGDEFKFIKLTCSGFDNINIHVQSIK